MNAGVSRAPATGAHSRPSAAANAFTRLVGNCLVAVRERERDVDVALAQEGRVGQRIAAVEEKGHQLKGGVGVRRIEGRGELVWGEREGPGEEGG